MSDSRPVTGSVTSQATLENVNPQRWRILSVLVVSLVVVILDNTVLNVALKTIQIDLGATQSQLIWAINSYTLVFAALLFTWGVLGDRFGRKRILIIGLTLFALASALSAFAANPTQLIIFRGLMGIGAASVLPVTLAIITVIFPPQERGKAIGAWAAAVGGAIALGPIVGGVLLENPSWFHWLTGNDWGSVFFINVPIIIVGIIGIVAIVPETKNEHYARLDPIGLLLSIIGLLAVVYGIQDAGWGRVSTYIWIGAGSLVIAGFLYFESRTKHPSLDLSLFRIRSFSVPLTGVSFAFAALQGSLLFLAFYYQLVRGWSPLQSGLLTLPFAVGQVLAAPRSAKMVQRFGARKVMSFGVSLASLAMLGIATLPADASIPYLIVIGFAFGFGLGNTIAPAGAIGIGLGRAEHGSPSGGRTRCGDYQFDHRGRVLTQSRAHLGRNVAAAGLAGASERLHRGNVRSGGRSDQQRTGLSPGHRVARAGRDRLLHARPSYRWVHRAWAPPRRAGPVHHPAPCQGRGRRLGRQPRRGRRRRGARCRAPGPRRG